ncbi:MAG: serine hydrolase [Planctomycetota bacterium]
MKPALAPALLLALLAPAQADDQSHETTPTDWGLENNVALSSLQDRISDGYRIVDIEVESVSPMRFSGVFVENAGAYDKPFRWETAATENDLDLAQIQGWRIVDLEPYRDVHDDLVFAYVAIPNAGSDAASDHGVEVGLVAAEVQDWVAANGAHRMTDLQVTRRSGTSYYTFCWVHNSGPLYSPWWYKLGLIVDGVEDYLSDRDARLVDFEPHAGTIHCSLLAVPSNGDPSLLDAPFRNLTWDEVRGLSESWASRPTDFERYSFQGSTRYALVLRRNESDLTFHAAYRMRDALRGPTGLDHGSTSGLLLREFDGAHSTVAGTNEHRTMRPQGLLRVAHHFAALRKVHLGEDSLATSVDVEIDAGGCPSTNGGATMPRPFTTALRDMMEHRDSFATDAFRRRYGEAAIEALAAGAAAPSIDLDGVLGCYAGQPDTATLRDVADLFGAVENGALGPLDELFVDFMSNSLDAPGSDHAWTDAIDDLLDASALVTLDRAALRNGIRVGRVRSLDHDGSGPDRAEGSLVEIPFIDGCEYRRLRFFVGAWVNDAHDAGDALEAQRIATEALLAHLVEAAIESWEDGGACLGWQNYGVPHMNSAGLRGTIGASGSRYVLENDLILDASGLPAGAVALLLVSPEEGFMAHPAGSMGDLLLGGPIGRDLGSIQAAGSGGVLRRPFDLTSVPTPGGPEAAQPGDVLHFQWWHRDVDPATGAQTSNFTNGLRVELR